MTRPIRHLFVYPIKSMAGMAVSEAEMTPRGFRHDRRWMVVDEQGKFISQRNFPMMVKFTVRIEEESLVIGHREVSHEVAVPLLTTSTERMEVEVWSDRCMAIACSPEADAFISDVLGAKLRLVYMPDDSQRRVEDRYNRGNDITSFSDGFPYLIVGTASLDELNRRLAANGYTETLGWDRFRPNIVVETEIPFEEDDWKTITLDGHLFTIPKPCGRCIITTTNQLTGERNAEPLKTLATFRMKDNKVLFGVNGVGENKNENENGNERGSRFEISI